MTTERIRNEVWLRIRVRLRPETQKDRVRRISDDEFGHAIW